MACDTDLSSKDHIIPDVRGSGESNLGAQQRAFPNFRSMPDLNQIVDFRAASNAGFTHAGPINARVRLDFDFVFNHGRTGLHNFVPLARVVSCEAKSIRADYGAILQDDVISNHAVLAHHSMGVSEEVIANPSAGIDHNMRQQRAMIPDLNIMLDDDIGADASVFSNFRRWMNYSSLVQSGKMLLLWMKKLNRPGKRQVRILMTKQGTRQLREIFAHNDQRRPCRACHPGVFRIGNKSDFARGSIFDPCNASQSRILARVLKLSPKPLR